ncbi:MAG TPA: hypothetical protein VL358_00245 [Caulobacteraceae bacterium]|jgi:hypothetical protein|nr:hypothetical protein [Caulobacteraceae bacterium]
MNPEFQRNLWLEAGPRRWAWTAVVLAAVYGAAVLIGGQFPLHALGVAGAAVFLVAALLWAPRIAGRAVADEVMQRTWDFQRLSALTPWEMAWGKLFGATSLAWIAASTGLVLATVATGMTGGGDRVLQAAISGIGAAVLLQAGSMALALVGVRRARAEGRSGAFRFTLGGLVGLIVVASALAKVLPTRGQGLGGPMEWITAGLGKVVWWGLAIPGGWFLAGSLLAFAAWALVAAWRLMRLELQMENFPWAWPLFALFAGVWAAGVVNAGVGARFAVAGAVFAACAYASAFAEPADRVRLRRFADALAARDLAGAAYAAPAVIAPVKLAALAVIGVALSPHGEGAAAPPALLVLAAFAFLLRDLGVVAYFRFGPRPGRGDFGAVLGLFLAYFVGGVVGSQIGGQTGMALFTPSPVQPAIAAVSGGVQAILVWILAWSRIRAPERSDG